MSSHDGTNSRGGSCEIHEPRLSAYLLDELASDERRDVEAHIAGCHSCREELALLSQTAEALRASPSVDGAIAPERRQALLAAAREETLARPAPRRPWGPAYGLLGLAAAALVVVSFMGVRMHREPGKDRLEERDLLAARASETPPTELVTRTATLTEDTLALTARVEELARNEQLAQKTAAAPGASPRTGAAPLGTERDMLYAWSAPVGVEAESVSAGKGYAEQAASEAQRSESERRRFMALERGRSDGDGKDLAKLDDLRDGTRGLDARVEFGGIAQDGAEARKPEADRAVLYEKLGQPPPYDPTRKRDVKRTPSTSGTTTTDLYLIEASKRAPGGAAGAGGAGGREVRFKDNTLGQAGRPEQELRELERTGGRQLDESLVRESREARGRGTVEERKLIKTQEFVDGIDLTRNALPYVHEFAPGPNPTRSSADSKSVPAPAGPLPPTDLAITGVEPAGAAPSEAAPAAGSRAAQAPAAARPILAGEPLGEVPVQGLGLEEKAAEGAAAAPPATLSAAARPDGWKVRVDEFLSRLDRRPGETPAMMFFRFWGDNSFVETSSDRLSTFGADVDTASFTLFRAYLYKQGILPPPAAVRTEEFVNYFRSRYAPPPADGPAFALHADLAPSPFAHEPEYQLLKVGLKGREVPKEKRKAAALIFVVDTSGSMRQENRLELVKDALRLLVRELDEGDSIGIVAFDREARIILEPSPGSETERILSAIAVLEPRQNTNVAAGLELGYRMAASRKIASGVNRVILLSDGVANTGVTDPDAMIEMTRAHREQGIFLTCVGVGMGNNNDALLERLADRGNGQCVYVDRIEEARKVFVENLAGTLETIAKDVKIQVEFDPARVLRYRLLGYENRNIADADFRDNKVDAGEVGAGHEVAALYELKLKPGMTPGDAKAVAATIRVRYLTPEHGEAVELKREVAAGEAKASFAEAPARFQVTACAAELAEVLRESYWSRGGSLAKVAGMLESILSAPDGAAKLGDDPDVIELVALLKKTDALVREREARATEVARTAEALKENAWLRSRIEDEIQQRRDANRTQLDEILRQNLELRQRLEELLRG